MYTENISYQLNGREFVGFLAHDEGLSDVRAGVLICHGGNGLDDHARASAERFAHLGYVAFALDYHGGGRPLQREEITPRVMVYHDDPELFVSVGKAGLDVLTRHDAVDPARIGAVGYCLGGTLALELARRGEDLKAVAALHGQLDTKFAGGAELISGRVLVCLGADDPVVPLAQRARFEVEMRRGRVDWDMQLYGGVGHSFSNPASTSESAPPLPQRFDPIEGGGPWTGYSKRADEMSWAAVGALLKDTLQGPSPVLMPSAEESK